MVDQLELREAKKSEDFSWNGQSKASNSCVNWRKSLSQNLLEESSDFRQIEGTDSRGHLYDVVKTSADNLRVKIHALNGSCAVEEKIFEEDVNSHFFGSICFLYVELNI